MSTLTAQPTKAESAGNVPARQKKALVRRAQPDRSQQIRRAVQFAFLLLNAVIGAQFVLWVRSFEIAGGSTSIERPAGVDGWLPIAGLMNLRYFLVTRKVPEIHPSAMVLLCAFLLTSVLVKKSFCSWLCPVGTFSEYLWKLGRKVYKRNFTAPVWLDLPLRSLKYIRRISHVAVQHRGRREDVELLQVHRHGRNCGDRDPCVLVDFHPELLVPFSLPVRHTHGSCLCSESGEDSARPASVYRLRQM
jgi:hypothetical protein